MAQIDSSIYSSFQAPDILGSIQKGLSVRDMINTRDKEEKAQKKEQALAEAYNAGVSKNPDGTVSYDGMKTASKLSDLGYGKESIETLQNYKAQQKASIEEQRKKLSEMTDYLGRASQSLKQNPGLYQNILQDAKARGFDVSTMPPQYGPDAQKMIDHYHGQALTVKDQVENQFKQQQFAAEQKWKQKSYDLDKQKAQLEHGKKSGALEGFKALDKDYAKDYNDFTSNGAENARGSIAKLREIRNELAKAGDGVFSAGGGRSEIFPDAFRSKTSVRWRDQAQSAANATLKSIFGGQLSDGERKAAAAEFYNDKLDNADNVKILDAKIEAMEQGLQNQLSKANYFSKYGSLQGFEESTALRGTTEPNRKEINQSPLGKPNQKQVFKTSEIDWAD